MPLLAAALLLLSIQDQPPRADCREWHECRQMALEAADRGEYERFHDLAWRAVQTGRRNDPALMYLLARAQSLSGRPGDALVMLQRLAALGVPTDAATSDDFRRVRNLPGWAEFAENAAAKIGAPDASGSSDKAGIIDPGRLKAVTTDKAGTTDTALPKAGTTDKGGITDTAGLKAGTTGGAGEAVRFSTLPFMPGGLAYDAVSRRFIVGDRRARRLAVVDEFSQHVANLASAPSAGFGDIVALEIDPRQGDLWVLSAGNPGATLHKLQLISGRSLASYTPADRFGSVDLVDVAAAPDNGVLVLDRAGHRIFHLRPKAPAVELSTILPVENPAALAPAGGNIVYVAHDAGISRVDLAARAATGVKAGNKVSLAGIARLRWHRGSLIAVQRTADGSYAVVRIDLDARGQTATSVRPLDAATSLDPAAVTISGGVLYYLAAADDAQMTVRKVMLK